MCLSVKICLDFARVFSFWICLCKIINKLIIMNTFYVKAHDRLAELERESLAQLAALESALGMAREERDAAAESKRAVEEEVATLRRVVNDQKRESRSRQSILEEKIQELISRGAQPDLSNNLGLNNLYFNL